MYPGVQSLAVLGIEIARGDDDDRNIPPGRLLLQGGDHGKAVHLWHHQIEQDHVGLVLLEAIQRLSSVRRLPHAPLRTLEPSTHSLALERIVLHQQDARGRRQCPKAANQLMKPLAVDRLGEIPGGAKRNAAAVLIHDRHHDDRNVGELGVLPQRSQDRPAVEVRHHDVERDHGRPQFLGKLEPLRSARRGHDGKSFRLEMIRYQLARGRIIVDDENTIGTGGTAAV